MGSKIDEESYASPKSSTIMQGNDVRVLKMTQNGWKPLLFDSELFETEELSLMIVVWKD